MTLYKTKNNNIINLDQVSVIYVDPEWTDKRYQVVTPSGKSIYFPDLTEEDIELISEIRSKLDIRKI